MEKLIHYFSYGSNMSIRRLLARVPSAKKADVGILEKHQLKFHKISKKDGSAKCDAYKTGNPEHKLYGVVFFIAEDEKPELDRNEGLGYGYEQKIVEILLNTGKTIDAFTYYATSISPELKPLDWYKEHVLRGARENDLPVEHIRSIEIIEHIEDSDPDRRDNELSIYR
ncbi:MAG: gamma-glutamylcyclotransferase [Gammaproteobacteria bacterium]|nr:gamma-glutamylcyclotransferase [Gammaproteobacteria bacterium]